MRPLRRPRARLAWRLYALGVLQLFVLAGAAFLLQAAARRGESLTSIMSKIAMDTVVPTLGDRAATQHRLDELKEQRKVEMSLYDKDGHLVATNVQPPLPLVRPEGAEGPPQAQVPYDTEGAAGTAIVSFERRPGPLTPQRTQMLVWVFGLLIVGVGSLFTARWLVRPLERLTRATRALGSGDLRTRVGLTRADELGEVGSAFDEMAERIEGLVRAEKELLANVSHELRTPLARIRVAIDLAAEGDADAARTALAEIGVDLAELEALIDDILTAVRFELAEGQAPTQHRFAMHVEEVAARALLDRSTERFRTRHPERPLVIEAKEDVPPLQVDPQLFRRVIDNLLENAHKYSPKADAAIQLSATKRDDAAIIEVIDEGIGIPEEDRARVFTPFFRSERSRSRGTGGVGLGLTLAKRIVEAHGGSIEAANNPHGHGTTLRVVLPTEARDAAV